MRPFTGYVSPELGGEVVEFDGEDGSVWVLDRPASVWRRLAGPGATNYLHRGSVLSWTREHGWTDPDEG